MLGASFASGGPGIADKLKIYSGFKPIVVLLTLRIFDHLPRWGAKTSMGKLVFVSLAAARNLRRVGGADAGVAALAVAGAISIVAFTALALFLSAFAGTRALERAQSSAGSGSSTIPAVRAYFYQQATPILPCPDRDLDGIAEAACDGGGNARSGTLPWATLGLSQQDAIDGNGKYFSYVVSNTARNVCFSVENDYDATDVEFTGSLIEATDLELITTAQSAGQGRYVPFAIISHGPNGYGTFTEGGTATPVPPAAHTFEDNNDNDNPTVLYTGPRNESGTNQFDDVVIAPTRAEMQSACETLTPGQALNAILSDNFDSGSAGINSAKFSTSATDAPTKTRDANNNGVASFSTANSYLATATTYDFSPAARPVYVAALWTPNPGLGATTAGFSLATRATIADLGAGTDIFNPLGLTFRFDDRDGNTSSDVGVLNNITIRDNTGQLAISGGQYTLINGETYLIEVFDNGDDVWMRITQDDDVTNTAFASTTNITSDLTGDQRVVFINGPVQSYIDEVVAGVPMLALELDGDGDYVATAGNDNGTATGDITLEAWIKPKSLPRPVTSPDPVEEAVVVSQWDDDDDAVSSYRLYLDGERNGQLVFEVAGSDGSNPAVDTFNLGFRPTVNEWAHVAVTYDGATQAMRFYLNGVLARSATGTVEGVRAAAQHFAVGADSVTTPPRHFFHGNVSDVRVWDDVRASDEIQENFQTRLTVTTNLVVNWLFDRESGGLAATTAAATPSGTGTASAAFVGNAAYVPTLANYFRPFSTTFCPAGTVVTPYQCDFRSVGTQSINIPNSLQSVYAKVWGAGGGGYDVGSNESAGGSAGFSAGLIENIGGTPIAGATVDIAIGGFGVGSTSTANGGGGGAASGIMLPASTSALTAGGGGGAGYSASILSGCSLVTGTANQCGIGGAGGGANAASSRPPDASTNCGGRPGGSAAATGPAVALVCTGGGADASGSDGGAGAVASTGGLSDAGNGGDAYANVSAPGAGGGGGGAVGGEAGGLQILPTDVLQAPVGGFGGGGGSGLANAGVTNPRGEAGGTSVVYDVDSSRSGDLQPEHASATQRRRIVNVTPNTTGLVAGASISGSCIPSGTTISSIVNASTIAMDMEATGLDANCQDVSLSITSATGTVSPVAGGDDDPDYSPSYLNATPSQQNPGRGGSTGANVSGRAGAIVLKW